MITERHEELAALHAFGLLDGSERADFEATLARDEELRQLTRELAATSAHLALAAPAVPPPAGLKDRILASAAATAPAPARAPVVPFPFLRLLPWAAAAGFAFVAGWLAVLNTGLRREAEDLRTERDLADTAYRMAQNQLSERSLLAERMITDLGQRLQRQQDLTRLKVTALAALVPDRQDVEAIAVWDPELEQGLLTVEKLPPLADTQDYQIWVIDPAYPIPVDGGVFRPSAEGATVLTFKGDKPVKTVNAFAISVEKKGGVPKAEGPIVLLGK